METKIKEVEVWPFYDLASGNKIEENRFYGFGDSGYLAGDRNGYDTQEEAVKAVSVGLDDMDYSTDPKDLGSTIAVISGREFVDRLYSIINEDEQAGFGWSIFEFGHWNTEESKKAGEEYNSMVFNNVGDEL